jgi:hypothetical protein
MGSIDDRALVAACGICGEVVYEADEETPQSIAAGMVEYAVHMWNEHPTEAAEDEVARAFIRAKAQWQAMTS